MLQSQDLTTECGSKGLTSDERPNDGSNAAKRCFKSQNCTGPSHKAPARLGSSGLSLLGAPGKWGKKKEIQKMSYLYVNLNPA